MSRTLPLLLFVLAAGARADDRAFVETVIERTTCFVEESITVRLRIGLEERLAKTQLVQMFQRPFDLPVSVHAPWLKPPKSGSVTLVLNGEPGHANRREAENRNGRRFLMYEIAHTLTPSQPGAIVFEAPRLNYVHAAEFRDDLVHGRTAVNELTASTHGQPVTLTVQALPEDGRPADFGGAVGRFRMRTTATPHDLDAGATLKLVLTIEGEGNFATFAAPSLDGWTGFHVYGALEAKTPRLRIVTYEIAPLHGGIEELPAIRFAYFDPQARAYRTAIAKPIPLIVHGKKPGPIAKTKPSERAGGYGWLYAALASIAVGLLSLVWFARRRRARATAPTSAERFHERAQEPNADGEALFTAFLAAHLGVPVAAVIGPDLARRLEEAGAASDVSQRTAMFVERLVGARYGGRKNADALAEASRLVDEISACRPL